MHFAESVMVREREGELSHFRNNIIIIDPVNSAYSRGDNKNTQRRKLEVIGLLCLSIGNGK